MHKTNLFSSLFSPLLSRESKMTLNKTRIAAFLGALGLAAGCGVGFESPDIDRTQPNIVTKDDLEGEWYFRAVIVDKQFENSYPFVGWQGSLDRVRFEVTEKALVAYRAFERVPGAEGADVGDNNQITSFPISSHFEVERAYNAVNGVESNVIRENTMDKDWWDRSKMRVSWSKPMSDRGLLARFGYGPMAGMLSGMTLSNIHQETNNDPAYPWKTRISKDYIESTIDAIVEPNYYACYVLAQEMNCTPTRIKMKLSFKKINPANDYEAYDYQDYEAIKYGAAINPITGAEEICFPGDVGCENLQELWVASENGGTVICDPERHDPDDCSQFTVDRFAKFGYFRTDRYLADRENGFTVPGRERLINRHNIWEKSYNADGSLIPYEERTVKPITYYMNVQYPEALFDETQDMADDWDVAFKATVAGLQGKNLDEVPRMYEVLENDCNVQNVNAYINANADVNFVGQDVNNFKEALANEGIGTLGYGNLENACAVLETYSVLRDKEDVIDDFTWQQIGDLRYNFVVWVPKAEISGPLGYGPSASDPITGEIISANANVYGASLDIYANRAADYVQLINGELTGQDVINGTNIREHVEATRARYADKRSSPEKAFQFMKLHDERTAQFSDEEYLVPQSQASLNSNLDKLAATGFEKEFMLTGEMPHLFGSKDPLTGKLSDDAIERALPSNWGRQSIPNAFKTEAQQSQSLFNLIASGEKLSAHELQERREDMFSRQSFCFLASQVEPALADLAAKVANDGMTREEMVLFFRGQILRGVLAHEVGHTLGLRHNFEGSADVMNFFPGWWGIETGDHRDADTDRKSELAYSSIMDYHQRFNGDWGGIGLYDKAAIKFGYGNLVEVFDESEDAFVPRSWVNNLSLFYPEEQAILFAGGDVETRLDDHYGEVIVDLYEGNERAVIDASSLGVAPKPENLFKRKDISFDEFMKQEARRIFGVPNPDGSEPLIEVPYSYCSDAYAWGGNLTCARWDMGSTSQEIVTNAQEMYDFYYPFNSFRGERIMSDPSGGSYMGRLYSRTYQPMLNAYRYFYFYRRSTATMWPLIRDWAAAAHQGADFFARVLQTPEPGRYCLENEVWKPETAGMACDNAFNVELGEGRAFNTSWTDEFSFRPQNIGHMYDKLLAIQAMTTNNAFFARDFSSYFSRGAFNISYYRTFQPEMLSLYGGLVRGDTSVHSARVQVVDGKANIVYKPLVEFYDNEYPDYETLGYPIEPSSNWMMRYYGLFFSLANFTSNTDRTLDFATRARISLVGSRNDPVIDASVNTVVFTDPLTNYAYKAPAIDGAGQSLGFDLLTDAKDFVENGAWAQADAAVSAKEAEIEAAEAADEDTAALKAELSELESALRTQNLELNQKVQIIDMVRKLVDILEYSQ